MKIEENINTTNNIVDEDDEVENGETLEVKLEDNEHMKQALEDLGPLLSDEDFDPGNFCTIFFCLFLFVYIFVYIFLPDAGGNTNDPDFEMEDTANDIREESKPEAKPKPKADTETQCYYCGQMFLVSQIKEHMSNTHGSYFGRMHGAPRPFQCHNCNGTFKTQSALGKPYSHFML